MMKEYVAPEIEVIFDMLIQKETKREIDDGWVIYCSTSSCMTIRRQRSMSLVTSNVIDMDSMKI